MIYIGCTEKLRSNLPTKKIQKQNDYKVTIKNWHASLKYFHHRKCILVTNDLTLFSVFLYGVKKKELLNLDNLIRVEIKNSLLSENFTQNEIKKMIDDEEIGFYRSSNRRVLGCMNDHIKNIDFMLSLEREKYIKDDNKINLLEICSQLNRTPMVSYLKGYPIDALRNYINE